MDIEKEKSVFLDIYKYYPSAIKFTFDVENECFVLSKKTPLDHEVATISQMNQQWWAWLACAKSKAQAVPKGLIDQLESTANFMRGMCFDPRLHHAIKEAVLNHVEQIEAEIEAQEPDND